MPDADELALLYAKPHDANRWEDHKLRIDVMEQVGLHLIGGLKFAWVADLSCGNGDLARRLCSSNPFLGDMAPGYQWHGPIEETIKSIPEVALFICSETIEHVDDPASVLRRIRHKSAHLLLSTPISETTEVGNPEHVWGFDQEYVGRMLDLAGWSAKIQVDLKLPGHTYNFQIWGCV